MTKSPVRPSVAIVHDYLTQKGGAERVVLAMVRAFPRAPVYTSLYEPSATFPEFGGVDVRPLAINRSALLRRSHRLALPLLAPSFSRLKIDADVIVGSSSGWAHGVRCSGKKIVYCYSPARWLYQRERYLPARGPSGAVLAAMRPFLVRWDHRAATGADGYLTSSRSVRDQIRAVYGIDAEVLPPPSGIEVGGAEEPIPGIEPGFFLCVARLLPYKNVAPVVEAMRSLPHQRLVVVGTGPEKASLQAIAPANAYFAGAVEDAQLRWLYSSCRGAVTASYEDYGLVPLEAAAFGRPTAALRFGGFLDTIDDGRTGLFFDNPDAADISDALRRLDDVDWDVSALRRHALGFSELAFISRLREVIENEAARN